MTGRRLEFRYKAFRVRQGLVRPGRRTARPSPARPTTDGFPSWYGWRGRQAPEFARHAKLVPGKIVDGSTKGLLTYTVRAPEGYQDGDGKKWPAVVILHGSNMNGKAYVNTIAAAWPDIAKDYLLIGINGETPSQTGDDPQFNYTYVNYVGRSTFKGFPGTDRESPALVSRGPGRSESGLPDQALLRRRPLAGGLPDLQPADELPRADRRRLPDLCRRDLPVRTRRLRRREPSPGATGRAAGDRPRQERPRGRFRHGPSTPPASSARPAGPRSASSPTTQAGHMFARLPVGEAIRWLEAQSSDDPARLLDFAEGQGSRRVVPRRRRRDSPRADADAHRRRRRNGLDRLAGQIDAKAGPKAKALLAKIQANTDGSWIDDFLAYRDEFEFADASRDVMKAFGALRGQHSELAQKALNDARAAFQQGRQNDGYAKYQEIVDKYYASSLYRNAKRWLAERK